MEGLELIYSLLLSSSHVNITTRGKIESMNDKTAYFLISSDLYLTAATIAIATLPTYNNIPSGERTSKMSNCSDSRFHESSTFTTGKTEVAAKNTTENQSILFGLVCKLDWFSTNLVFSCLFILFG
ncbi:MAG: hypothetical protein ACXAD7_10305 [Candidatus Kariarchaeaceae archaeon]